MDFFNKAKNPRIIITREIDVNLICHKTDCLRNAIRYRCSCQPLIFHETIKHLGIHLDADMKFNTHVTTVSNILRYILYKCYRLSKFFPISTKRVIYFSMVQSIVYYGITVYYLSPEYIKKPLSNVLNRIVKVLFSGVSHSMLGIMSFEALGKYTDLSRNYFNEDFRENIEVEYNLRQRQYRPIRYYNSYGKHVPEYRIPTLLNSLPIELRTLQSKNEMKVKLKNYFLSNS